MVMGGKERLLGRLQGNLRLPPGGCEEQPDDWVAIATMSRETNSKVFGL